MSLIQRAGRFLSGTPLYRPATAVYDAFQAVADRPPVSTLLDYYYIGRHGPLVRVEPNGASFEPYLVRLESGGKLQRQRARGVYEPHVMAFLEENITPESVFWELGAAWGYFSLAAASRVEQVCSFEMMEERAGYIRKAADANGFDNVTVVDERLDAETDFTAYPRPDTVLVDIEGWEYVVLSTALEQLPDVPTWIVEVHSEVRGIEAEDTVDEMEALFADAGYTTRRLNEWSEKNAHIVAERE